MAKTQNKKAEKPAPHNHGAFLDLPPEASEYERSRAVVLPMPLEESVSYGGGAANGPVAILEASSQVELYDHNLDCEPALDYGVHTLPTPAIFQSGKKADAAAIIDAIAEEAGRHLARGKFVIGLGGEHTASLGLAKAVATTRGDFTLVHIDAHADLRDSYQDNPLSHASVVRRIAELPQCRGILQLGIRSTSVDQMEFVRNHAPRKGKRPVIRTWFADDIHGKNAWRKEFKKAVSGKRVFFTFDVDGLDPAIIPATGTPEPNGLTWRQLMRIVKLMVSHAECVVAMDCVELAPYPGLHHADFAVAKAIYEIASMVLYKPGR